jgi:citrate lyase synthetase
MKIVNANTLTAKDVLMEMISNIKTSYTTDAINQWLTFSLGTDLFNTWIAFENDEPVGMITGEVVDADGPSVFIAYNYVKPGVAVNGELVQRIEDWAKQMQVTKLLFYTKTSPRTFIKKYGFELVQSVLKKELKNGSV